ncbi:MAG: hypothetical protein KDJ38_19070 [Gammaproteobacteria bacterium]|nr:hypothetical protein [Gammaproteobacteria bacterium]
MDVHELKTLNFSEALSRLEEKVITLKSELEDAKARARESEDAQAIAEKLAREHELAEEKLARLRNEKSFDMAGRNHGIMTEVIEALDYISEKIQKMLHLL